MKASLKFAALSLALLCSCQSNDGWQKLFNGKDLTGFKQLNGASALPGGRRLSGRNFGDGPAEQLYGYRTGVWRFYPGI